MIVETKNKIKEEIRKIEEEHTNASTQYQNFKDRDLSGTDFSNMDLSGSNFVNADLTDCNFDNAVLHYCNFKNAILDNVSAKNAKAFGAAWFDVDGADKQIPQWMERLRKLKDKLETMYPER